MSVASEFAPEVVIPARARRTMVPGVGSPTGEGRHLALVPAAGSVSAPGSSVAPLVEKGAAPAPTRSDRRVSGGPLAIGQSWPLLVEPAPRSVRLTRRGIVVAVLATMLACAALLLIARLSASPSVSPSSGAVGRPAVGVVTVQPGDTLWSIAQQVQPGRDPRQVVDQLRRVNRLHSVALTPGQTLKVS